MNRSLPHRPPATNLESLRLRDKVRSGFENRLGSAELRRRLWHISPGLLPFLLWPIPHKDPLGPWLFGIVVILTFGLAYGCWRDFHTIRRSGEAGIRKSSSVLGYALPVLATLLLLPGHLEVGFGVLATLAFGDGSATLGGKLIGGPKLPWNREKTWAGLLCFLGVGIPMVAIIYWGETHNALAQTPGVSISLAFACAAFVVTLAALVESIPIKLNDNIRVGVTAVVAFTSVHFLWVV